MPQSLANIMVHIVFSTKDRTPSIALEIQPELHAYMAAVLQNLGCIVVEIGGMPDHVHILFQLPRDRTVSELVKDVKTSSSRWMKEGPPKSPGFQWQGGYGAFSVGPSALDDTTRYIREQAEHHKRRSFQDEFRALLDKWHIAFNEKFVWD